jgi:AraC-like DNA-binding protein
MKLKNSWQVRYWRVPHLDNVELLHCANITYDYPLHMHEEFSIGLVLQGTETTTSRGASHTAQPGNLFLINAEEVHSSRSQDTEYRAIKIRADMFTRIASEICERDSTAPHFLKPIINDRHLFRALLQLHLKLEQNLSSLEHESEFVSIMGMLLAGQKQKRTGLPTPRQEPHYVKLTRNYLRSHFAENVSLAQLTAVTSLSPFHLLRVFRNQVGCPPHEYQTQVRIAHARKLLRKGRSISDVALETGFFDQSHFSRSFKRIVGVPPGQYWSQSRIQSKPQSNIVQDTPVRS